MYVLIRQHSGFKWLTVGSSSGSEGSAAECVLVFLTASATQTSAG